MVAMLQLALPVEQQPQPAPPPEHCGESMPSRNLWFLGLLVAIELEVEVDLRNVSNRIKVLRVDDFCAGYLAGSGQR